MPILVILFAFFYHPFHVSVTHIYYKPQEKIVQLEIQIFLDDLENALKKHTQNESLKIEEDADKISKYMATYLEDKIEIVSENKPLPILFIGNEIDTKKNEMWCFLEIEEVEKFDTFKIRNTLLIDYIKKQENIIHYKFNGNTKSKRTYYGKEWAFF